MFACSRREWPGAKYPIHEVLIPQQWSLFATAAAHNQRACMATGNTDVGQLMGGKPWPADLPFVHLLFLPDIMGASDVPAVVLVRVAAVDHLEAALVALYGHQLDQLQEERGVGVLAVERETIVNDNIIAQASSSREFILAEVV